MGTCLSVCLPCSVYPSFLSVCLSICLAPLMQLSMCLAQGFLSLALPVYPSSSLESLGLGLPRVKASGCICAYVLRGCGG